MGGSFASFTRFGGWCSKGSSRWPGRLRRNRQTHVGTPLWPCSPDDPSHTEYLVDRLVREDVHPHEISVIRQALFEHDRASLLIPRLWRLVSGATRIEPAEPGRRRGSGTVQSRVTRGGSSSANRSRRSWSRRARSLIGDWREVFQPVQRSLVGPLRAIFGDVARPRERRWPIACSSISRSNRATPIAIGTWRN